MIGSRDPEELEAEGPAHGEIAATTKMGPVHLSVADLERSLDYYSGAIGLETIERGAGRASLGSGGRELLVLVEEPDAGPSDGFTGLYHFALLVPERADLARWLAHAARDQVSLTGLSDHAVSEAIYLRDPDRHGIEIYADRPRSQWEGQVGARMTTLPLDVENLLGELGDLGAAPFGGLAAGTIMGHVHLKVADIPATVEFYRDVIGFGLIVELRAQAAFLSAGGRVAAPRHHRPARCRRARPGRRQNRGRRAPARRGRQLTACQGSIRERFRARNRSLTRRPPA